MSKQFTFNTAPSVAYRRSKFDLSHGIKTTCNVGQLIPFDFQEVLAGDTFKCNTNLVARVTSSFIKPVIDTLYAEVFHFYVPSRLLYDDYERVYGNPKPSSYTQNDLATIPTTTEASTVASGTIADYLGLPVGNVPKGLSVLPFRAYAMIYNTWFRNENVIDEVYINTGEVNANEQTLNNNDFSATNYMGKPAYVGRRKDLFSACLPQPQKGEAPSIPLGVSAPLAYDNQGSLVSMANYAPLLPFDTNNETEWAPTVFQPGSPSTRVGIKFNIPSLPTQMPGNTLLNLGAQKVAEASRSSGLYVDNPLAGSYGTFYQIDGHNLGVRYKDIADNVYADLSAVPGVNVNDLRFIVQMQKMLEKDARFGTRYNEYLAGHFGVTSPDSRLQLPEYLGGARIPISVTQVTQTSESTSTSPLANVSGYSLTNGKSRFTKGFVEPGYVMSFVVIRQLHTYSQGIEKLWSRTKREDFYDPLFANLGEQPIYQSELYALGKTDLKDHVFGYNEAWAEYRYRPSKITGQLRTGVVNSLDVWHFGDNYANAPTLTADFINENPNFVDRTLSVPHTSQDQFLLDFWMDEKAIRVMPTYSIPGLIDHH